MAHKIGMVFVTNDLSEPVSVSVANSPPPPSPSALSPVSRLRFICDPLSIILSWLRELKLEKSEENSGCHH